MGGKPLLILMILMLVGGFALEVTSRFVAVYGSVPGGKHNTYWLFTNGRWTWTRRFGEPPFTSSGWAVV